MASDAATLAVRIEARLDALEKQLKKAGQMADDTARDMEKSFEKANDGISKSFFKGLVAKDIFDKAIGYVKDFIEQLKEIEKVAKLAQSSLSEMLGGQLAAGKAGVGAADFTKGMESFVTLLDEAGYKTNKLRELLEANGLSVRDQAGNLRSWQAVLGDVLNLIQNAKSEVQAIRIAELAGLTREWVAAADKGGKAFLEAQAAAANTVRPLEEMVQKGEDFEKAWKAAIKAVGETIYSAMLEPLSRVIRGAELLGNLGDLEGLKARRAAGLGLLGRSDPAFDETRVPPGTPTPTPPRRPAAFGTTSEGGRSVRDPSRPLSVIPVDEKGGGKGRLDSFEREERRIRERTAALEEETAVIGQSLYVRTKAAEQKRLELMLDREGLPLTEERRTQILALSDAYAQAVVKQAEALQQQRQMVELGNFLGSQLSSSIKDLITGAATLEDVMKRVADAILQAALNALILGQGPLAGLLGTGPAAGGQLGGLMGMLGFGGKRAAGGPVGAGRTYLVGESGPELVRFGKSGVVMPNSAIGSAPAGGAVQQWRPTFMIDARGAQVGVAEQIRAALKAYDRELLGNIQNKQMRYA